MANSRPEIDKPEIDKPEIDKSEAKTAEISTEELLKITASFTNKFLIDLESSDRALKAFKKSVTALMNGRKEYPQACVSNENKNSAGAIADVAWLNIFSYLDCTSLLTLISVCKKMNNLVAYSAIEAGKIEKAKWLKRVDHYYDGIKFFGAPEPVIIRHTLPAVEFRPVLRAEPELVGDNFIMIGRPY